MLALRRVALAGLFGLAPLVAGAAPLTPPASPVPPAAAAPAGSAADALNGLLPGERLYADSCCRHCSKGKACGDSCIARDKTCHAGHGCACN